jgi:hypothetical protein
VALLLTNIPDYSSACVWLRYTDDDDDSTYVILCLPRNFQVIKPEILKEGFKRVKEEG